MKDTNSIGTKMENWYSVKVMCGKANCPIGTGRSQAAGSREYVAEVEDYQLVLPVLYAHAQHGGCPLKMELDGAKWPIKSK